MASLSFLRGGWQPAARIIRPPLAGEFHTCGLRGVNSNAHVVGFTIEIYLPPAGGKVCDAGACFLPVGQKMRRVRDEGGCVDFECGGLFAAGGSECGTGDFACLPPEAANAAWGGCFYRLFFTSAETSIVVSPKNK